MIRLLLCMLIIGCSTLIGFSYSSKLSKRKDILNSFLLEIKNARILIRYSSKKLYELFDDSFTCYKFDANEPFSCQWDKMLCTYSKVLAKDDIKLLSEFGGSIGKCDVSGELNNIDMYINLLETRVCETQQIINSKSKIYKTLGLSFGLAIAIVLV